MTDAGRPRPGDAARQALRAARERAGSAPDPGGDHDTPAAEAAPADNTDPRPADSAREALRGAAVSGPGGEGPGTAGSVPAVDEAAGRVVDEDAGPAVGGESQGVVGSAAGGGFGAAAGGRPGDVAREALRAARREALRAEAAQPRRVRRAPAAPRTPSPPPPPPAPAPEPDEPAPPAPAPAPAPPHVPATMATPHRDGELRRTFPAFAPRADAAGDGPFAGTWWGNAWVEALERGALDAGRLVRGRGYADQGHVDAITVTPGLVLAYVRGSRPRPYRVQVRVRTLEDEDWERFLDAAADRPGHIAALLDKELPHSLADCGVPLLPGPGDLAPRCSCPDSGHPCKHAAALCYQTARLLDADPFVLLLLRGRGEKELLDALSRRSAARAARAARERQPETLPGIRATDALAERERPPLPPPMPVPPHPGQPPVYPSAPGGPDPFALDQLATDAAARAHALLGTGRDPVGELTLWQDAVRLAAARPGSGLTAATRTLYATLAGAAGRTPAELARAVAAWRQGSLAGLEVLEEPWDPPAGRFDRARPLLLAADLPAFRPWRNRLTHPRGHVQLRLGRDGLWYAYESEPGQDDWWPRGTPDLDPVGALTGLGIPEDCL
ncbi:SWIM zinc finger family protein [Streptomyces sp. NRRL S-1022]|uniref:SWIM zinc finger family protein n=1 Tax=Streptomyces sp. NRRL S-1022 TaxID=1463880 RepID=UPI001F357420|nr:SWIM zinc finger family protein [Streptomyces sp. NRRL S-1022]